MSHNPEKILAADEIYSMLVRALADKQPVPPADWSIVKLDEEVLCAGREYEPDPMLRQRDALLTALYYLVDFASRMPERVDVSENNGRVREMCGELAAEIVKITAAPDEIIAERGKLKSWLKAFLAVQVCFIYREETERHIAEQDALKRTARHAPVKKDLPAALPTAEKWQSDLAKDIFQEAFGKPLRKPVGAADLVLTEFKILTNQIVELMPPDVRGKLPKLCAQEKIEDPIVHLKFFFPAADWTWFVTEGEAAGDDLTFYGCVIGFEREWGYFSLREFEDINVHHLTVERDLYFKPEKMSICLDRWKQQRGAGGE